MNTKALETLQLSENRHMCEALKASGDQSDVARTVVHKLEFISDYKRRDLLEELEELGFTINENFVTEEGYNGLIFEREDKVTFEDIEALTLSLIPLLDQHDARYGGWTTSIIP